MLLCRYEMLSLWDFMLFAAQFSYEISLWEFTFCGSLSALRMRLHACLAVMRCLDDISCFSAAEFSFWWLDVRMVERWIWKMREVKCTRWFILNIAWFCVCKLGGAWWKCELAGDECQLGDRRVCLEVVWFVPPACTTSSRYVCLRIT